MMTPADQPAGDAAPDTDRLTAWDLFVLRHRHPGNLAVHAASFALFWGCPPLALITRNPFWLIGFLLSGLLGSAGHWLFDEGEVSVKEATHDPKVPFFVAIMFWKIVTRTYTAEIDAALARYAKHRTASTEPAPAPDRRDALP